MELVLNLVWILLAMVLVRFWLRTASPRTASTMAQVVALTMLIVILFPVISVTDDLEAIQNPAEIDCCARRNHAASCSHTRFPAVATLPPPVLTSLSFGFLRFAVPNRVPAPLVKNPAMGSVQNRPPPAA
jgi:hypothetical protein